MKVLKFGGTSMADTVSIGHIFGIIKSSSENRLVVVSAMGKSENYPQKITDALAECWFLAKKGHDFSKKYYEITYRYINLVRELKLKLNIFNLLKEIRDKLDNGAEYDFIISRGEYLSAKILAEYIGYEFIDASECICFDDTGKPDLPLSLKMTENRLKECRGAVIPGFYGITPTGHIKTFSRGGSDITGAIIAAAVKAGVYENWTDVDGFYRCDPKIVPQCGVVKVMTYDELRELSYMGAEVLHPEAIYPARLADIPINIRNTFNPKAMGTMIVTSAYEKNLLDDEIITGIAGKAGFIGILVEKTMMNSEIGFVCGVLKIFEKYGISIEHLPTGIDSVTVVVDKKFVETEVLSHIILEISYNYKPDNIQIIEDLSLIAIAGHGISERTDVSYRICRGLAKQKINMRFINKTTNDLSVIVAVEDKDYSKAIRSIYNEFFG